MRLLNTSTYKFRDSQDPVVLANPQYAILSHRWQHPETTLQSFSADELRDTVNFDSPQQYKIRNACAKARSHDPALE